MPKPYHIFVGDALETLRTMHAGTVNTCVTSPPYFGLRDYGTASWSGGDAACDHRSGNQVQDNKAPGAIQSGVRPGCDASKCSNCGAVRVDQQIGLESTPDAYIARLVGVFAEVRRVLRDDGTLWVNLGDSYAGSWGAQSRGNVTGEGRSTLEGTSPLSARQISAAPGGTHIGSVKNTPGLKAKDLIGIPWMLAFALRADGWYLRQDIIWAKPNPMPESVTDRCTKAHEYIFLLSKSRKYYFDRHALSEPCSGTAHARTTKNNIEEIAAWRKLPNGWDTAPGAHGAFHRNGRAAPEETRLSPKTVAPGQGIKNNSSFARATILPVDRRNKRSVWTVTTRGFKEAHFATFPPALIEPCILAGAPVGGLVLDPFAGAGTTGMVALKHGRAFAGIELNPEYAAMAERRIEKEFPTEEEATA